MAVKTVTKTIGTTGVFSLPQLFDDGASADLVTSEQSAAGTFAVASFTQGESLSFVGSGATGKFLDTDSTGPGTGTFVVYGITAGNPAASDVVTGGTSLATCILSSGTPDFTGIVWQGLCQNQEFSGTGTQLTFSGSTANTSAFKSITCEDGASFRDHANVQTNALRYNPSNGAAIKSTSANAVTIVLSEVGATVRNLQVLGESTNARGIGGGSSSVKVRSCIIEGTYTATGEGVGIVGLTNAAGVSVQNTVIIQRASAADHIIGMGLGSPSYLNNTIVTVDDVATPPTSIFISDPASAGTVTVQNCGMFAGHSSPGPVLEQGPATFNFTTCYSDISGTAGVTDTPYSAEFESISDATRDYRLKTGAAQIDTGTTDASNVPTDIVGTARPQGAAYDVGAWELVVAAVGKIFVNVTGRVW